MLKKNPNTLDRILKETREALEIAGLEYERKIKTFTPVDTGELKNSITVDKSDLDKLIMRVGAKANYAPAVEFGTSKRSPSPFFRPAIKAAKSKINKIFNKKSR